MTPAAWGKLRVNNFGGYDVFGRPSIYNSSGQQIQTSAFGNRFMFTGREFVANFAVYEYRNRAYHPGLGRFMSEDPKGFDAGDHNLFRYVMNDPLDKTDPMGLDDIAIPGEWDKFGVLASMNSYNATRMAKDSHGRSQLVQQNIQTGRISLQTQITKGHPVDVPRPEWNQTHTGSAHRYIEHEPAQRPDPGYRAIGPGHVHWDIGPHPTPERAKWSPFDIQTATTTSEHLGLPVWRVDASDPGQFLRLTPQTKPGEPPRTERVKVAGLSYAGGGYFQFGHMTFTNGNLQKQAGNYGAWNANRFGAFQSSPFNDDGNNDVNPHLRAAGL